MANFLSSPVHPFYRCDPQTGNGLFLAFESGNLIIKDFLGFLDTKTPLLSIQDSCLQLLSLRRVLGESSSLERVHVLHIGCHPDGGWSDDLYGAFVAQRVSQGCWQCAPRRQAKREESSRR